jgi:hypothetical protein
VILSTQHTFPAKNCIAPVRINVAASFPFIISIDQFLTIAAGVHTGVSSIFISKSIIAPAIVIAA